jgi:hypothetical protein
MERNLLAQYRDKIKETWNMVRTFRFNPNSRNVVTDVVPFSIKLEWISASPAHRESRGRPVNAEKRYFNRQHLKSVQSEVIGGIYLAHE